MYRCPTKRVCGGQTQTEAVSTPAFPHVFLLVKTGAWIGSRILLILQVCLQDHDSAVNSPVPLDLHSKHIRHELHHREILPIYVGTSLRNLPQWVEKWNSHLSYLLQRVNLQVANVCHTMIPNLKFYGLVIPLSVIACRNVNFIENVEQMLLYKFLTQKWLYVKLTFSGILKVA